MSTLVIELLIIGLIVFNKTIDPYLAHLIEEKDLSLYINEDPHTFCLKRVKKAKVILILLIPWHFTHYSVLYFTFVIFLFVFFLKKDYIKFQNETKQQINQIKFQFPVWLRQLQILLQTNTVVQSMKYSCATAPQLIQHDLEILIQSIEADALNLSPYLQFLHQYRLAEVERAMKLLYRYNTVGKEDAYNHLNRMIQTTTKWLRNERNSRNESKLAAFQWISMIPLFSVTVLFMAIMFEIIMNIFQISA